jgi:cytochrome c1
MMRRVLFVLAALALAPAAAFAHGGGVAAGPAFSFDAPFGGYDRAAVQRGFQVYTQVCAACHSLRQLSYRNLGEEGGPFAAYRVPGHDGHEAEIVLNAEGLHGAKLIEANDNPYVRQIASEIMVPTVDDLGQPSERAGRPSDRFKAPFANDAQARAANGGALPPDLSVITLARFGGAHYVRSLLTGFTGDIQDGKYVNTTFSGGLIGMAPPLQPDMVTYQDGTPATVEQMASDVARFLQWAADPHMEARKRMGLVVILFLTVLLLMLYLSYKAVWRGVKH